MAEKKTPSQRIPSRTARKKQPDLKTDGDFERAKDAATEVDIPVNASWDDMLVAAAAGGDGRAKRTLAVQEAKRIAQETREQIRTVAEQARRDFDVEHNVRLSELTDATELKEE